MDSLNKAFFNIIIILGLHFLLFCILGYFIRDAEILNSMFGGVTYSIYFFGLVLGFLFSVFKFYLLKRTLNHSLTMSKNQSILYTNANYFLRFLLTGVVFYIGATNSSVDFFGVIVGVLSLQSSTFISGFFIKDDPSLKIDNSDEN